jgi:hypothetical protein
MTEAAYAQPSGPAVLQQAFTVWQVLLEAITIDSDEAMQTVLLAGELWSHYLLLLGVQVGPYTEFVKTVQAAPSDDETQQALRALLQRVRFRVFNTQTNQFVDEKDFTNKYFGGG